VAVGLRNLSLSDTPITDQGLEHVLALRQLDHLNLSKTKITNSGLAHLSRLSELTELNLEGTSVGDPGLTRLAAVLFLPGAIFTIAAGLVYGRAGRPLSDHAEGRALSRTRHLARQPVALAPVAVDPAAAQRAAGWKCRRHTAQHELQ
jgi:hypothetical protein